MSGSAGEMEWPAFEVDPAEPLRLARRWTDAGFFDDAMRGALGQARVIAVKRMRSRLGGLSGSSLRKFRLKLSDGSMLDVVAKASRTGLGQEALFYQRIAPEVPIRIARLYGTARNPEGGAAMPPILILEALTPAIPPGALSPEMLRTALGEVARLHARFWGDGRLARHDFLIDATVSNAAVFRRRLEFAMNSILDRQRLHYFPRFISDGARELIERLASNMETILGPLRALAPTLLHGDLNPANMLVLSESEREGSIGFIDWQNLCRGPAIVDLVYLFHMTRFRGPDRMGRPVFGEPILEWGAFTACYFEALERELGGPVDRHAHLSAAPAADLALTLRLWIPYVGIALDSVKLDFMWRRMGWLFRPLLRWARIDRLLDHFLKFPLARLEPNALALGLA
jgi:Phosphotransferase enzyme family